jgi:hypothetical protein
MKGVSWDMVLFPTMIGLILAVILTNHEPLEAPHAETPARTQEDVEHEWTALHQKRQAAGEQFLTMLGLTLRGSVVCTTGATDDFHSDTCNAMTNEMPVPLVFECTTRSCIILEPPARR